MEESNIFNQLLGYLKKVVSFFQEILQSLMFKKGLLFGLYYWLQISYQLFLILVPFFHSSHIINVSRLFNIYNDNKYLLSLLFILICLTQVFVNFNYVDLGGMVWNGGLLTLLMFIIFFIKDTDINSNIILKTVFSLGTIESFIKNIFKSRELEKKAIDRAGWHKLYNSYYDGLMLKNDLNSLNITNNILELRHDILEFERDLKKSEIILLCSKINALKTNKELLSNQKRELENKL